MQQRRIVLQEVDRLRAESDADPDNPALLNELGATLLRVNDGREALFCLTRAVMMHRRPAYLYNLGLAHMSVGNMPAAQEAFASAREQDPSTADYWHHMAKAMRLNGDIEGAEREFAALLQGFPEHVESQVERAYCLQDSQQSAEAIAYLEACVTHAPHVASYRLALIQVLCEQGHLPDARPHLQWLQERGDTVQIDAFDGDVRVSINGRPVYDGLMA